MAILNFPENPSPGDTWTVGNKTYVWNGTAWIVQSTNLATLSTLIITSSTNATSTNTGALQVVGGVGIGQDLWVGGDIYIKGQQLLTTSSFAYSLEAGDDISITLSTTSGGVIFSNVSTLQSVTTRGATTDRAITITNVTSSTSATTGALVISGGVGIAKDLWVSQRVNAESLKISDALIDSSVVTVTLNASEIVDTYSLNQFRAAKYFIQVTEGSGPTAQFQAQEVTLLPTNTGTVNISVYGEVSSLAPPSPGQGALGNFSADVSGSSVRLIFTPHFATSKTVRILRTAMSV